MVSYIKSSSYRRYKIGKNSLNPCATHDSSTGHNTVGSHSELFFVRLGFKWLDVQLYWPCSTRASPAFFMAAHTWQLWDYFTENEQIFPFIFL
jgi:hypothetical protein